nr:putative polyprotein [Drosophila-associated tymovirus]
MAYQNVFDALSSTIHRDTITNPIIETVASPLRSSLLRFPWKLPTQSLHFANSLGINVSAFAALPHPHPFHKTVETHLLFEHWKNICRHPSSVFFMKPSKFNKLQKENPFFSQLINFRFTAEDICRYPLSSPQYTLHQSAFIHDALMYFSPAQIVDLFLNSPALQNVFASLVVPPEIHLKLPSLFPFVYRVHYSSDDIIYSLEDNTTGNYRQPISSVDWLRLRHIQSGDMILTVAVLESWGSIHSLLITRASFPQPPERFFLTPRTYELPQPSDGFLPLSSRLVPREVYDAIFNYVRAVRTLRVTDPTGFIRTQRNKPEYSWVSSAAWDHLAQFALSTCSERPALLFYAPHSWIQRFLNNLHLSLQTHRFSFQALASSLPFLCIFQPFHLKTSLRLFSRQLFGSPPPKHYAINILPLPDQSLLRKIFRPAVPAVELVEVPKPFYFHMSLLKKWKPSWNFASKCLLGVSCAMFSYAVYRKIFHPLQPQARSDIYLEYFHGEDWKLSLPTYSTTVLPRSFFGDHCTILPMVSEPDIVPKVPPTTIPAPATIVTEPPPPSPTPAASKTIEIVEEPPHLETASGSTLPTDEPPVTINESLLAADPSANGPILPFRELTSFPLNDHEGHFLSRHRIKPSTLPTPKEKLCLFEAISAQSEITVPSLFDALCEHLPDSLLQGPTELAFGFSNDHLTVLAWHYRFQAIVYSDFGIFTTGPREANLILHLRHQPGHWSVAPPNVRGSRSWKTSSSSYAEAAKKFSTQEGFLLPFRQVHSYQSFCYRAKNLASNMKNETDGMIASIHRQNPHLDIGFFQSLDARCDYISPRKVQLIHLSGFPGCGKSHPVAKMLNTPPFSSNFKIAVPTTELRTEWKNMLRLRSSEVWRVSTWETSLIKARAPVLVIDEVYKLPNGYLDLAIAADPLIQFVILLGDPCQASYASLSPDSSNHRIPSEIDHLSPYRDFYCFWTYRCPKTIAKLFSVPSFSSKNGSILRHSRPNRKNPLIVASISSCKIFQGSGIHSTTIAASQGITHRSNTQLFIDRNIALLHHSTSLVAITRSTTGVTFTGNHAYLTDNPGCNPILEAAYTQTPINFQNLFYRELNGTELLLAPFKIRPLPILRGASSSFDSCSRRFHRLTNFVMDPAHPRLRAPLSRSAKPLNSSFQEDLVYSADLVSDFGSPPIPQISTHFLPETRRPLHQDIPTTVPELPTVTPSEITDACIEPVYPGCDYTLLFQNLIPPHDPSDREIRFKNETSNQFPHVDVPFEFGSQPPSLVSPIHNSKNDPTLLPASIDKRLRFRPSSSPYQITAKDEALGSLLFDSLNTAYHRSGNPIPFDPILFSECINLNECAQLSSKTQNVIMANALRSDPDWRHTVVRIFSKTQHKVNEGSIFGPWKACQTLALMHDAIILCLGPVKKYQRIFDKEDRPPNLFIYGGHTPFDLSLAAQQALKPGMTRVCNDYTAFDQSQLGEAVVLERLKMNRLNIPKNLIDMHVYIKTHLECQFGPLTCMRFTGEPGTYDDNTDYNIAIIYSEYLIQSEKVFVSGDDSFISSQPLPNPLWPSIQPLLSIKFKKEFVQHGLFCGYYLGPEGAIRSPRALLAKLAVATADGSLDDKLASYLSEFVVGHSLGDAFWNLLPLKEVEYQAALFDFFCRNCSKEQKISLKIGEVPSETCSNFLSQGIKWLSRPLYSLLNRAARLRLLGHSSSEHAFDDPSLEGVLQRNL